MIVKDGRNYYTEEDVKEWREAFNKIVDQKKEDNKEENSAKKAEQPVKNVEEKPVIKSRKERADEIEEAAVNYENISKEIAAQRQALHDKKVKDSNAAVEAYNEKIQAIEKEYWEKVKELNRKEMAEKNKVGDLFDKFNQDFSDGYRLTFKRGGNAISDIMFDRMFGDPRSALDDIFADFVVKRNYKIINIGKK